MQGVDGKIAYLGDEYSYSHAAAERLTGGELIAFDTLYDTVSAVGKTCDFAVVPVENNVEGAVNEVYDALWDSGLYFVKQIVLPIRHCLIAAQGATLGGIRRVVSHPQALAQCRLFLKELGLPTSTAPSTSYALRAADIDTAAIGIAPRDGQIVLARDISDSKTNATRFALLSERAESTGHTASAMFDLKNEPGALFGALRVIDAHGVNLTRILSRPHRSGDGRYRFFIDFDFDGTQAEFDSLADELSAHCDAFRSLGRYDVETAEP